MSEYRPRFGPLIDKTGIDPFCGPTILSIISGIDAREIEKIICRRRRGRGYTNCKCENIVGMAISELRAIAENMGFLFVSVRPNRVVGTGYRRNVKTLPTLARWLKDSESWRNNDIYLIVTSSHFLMVSGNQIVDNQLRFPRNLDQVRHYRRAKIHDCYCIMKP